jgi:hypothetical protein
MSPKPALRHWNLIYSVHGAPSSGVKLLECPAQRSSSTCVSVKKAWIYTSTPHTPSWRRAQLSTRTTFTLEHPSPYTELPSCRADSVRTTFSDRSDQKTLRRDATRRAIHRPWSATVQARASEARSLMPGKLGTGSLPGKRTGKVALGSPCTDG